jgi:tetratricopeptide (TPR) repeat protein
MGYDDLFHHIEKIVTCGELNEFTEKLRVIAANEKSDIVLRLIEKTLHRSEVLNNKKASINLKELQIKQLFGYIRQIPIIEEILFSMKSNSEELNYLEGTILSYSIEWGIERFKGNKNLSHTAIQKAISLLEKHYSVDKYVYNVCRYSYAIDNWLGKHDLRSKKILEECFTYFISRGIFKGAIHSLGYLSLIYNYFSRRTEAIEMAKKLITSEIKIEELSKDLQSVAYYFLGIVFKLDFRLVEAEKNLIKSKEIFESNLNENIFSSYYITTLSHLTTTYALQGKLRLASDQMKRVEELLKEEIMLKNLDFY